jgi:hypothetical protein
MSENPEIESLGAFKTKLDSKIQDSWSTMLKQLSEKEDNSLSPQDLLNMFAQFEEFVGTNVGLDIHIENEISLYAEDSNLSSNAHLSLYWQVMYFNSEALILGELTRSLNAYVEYMNIEGNLERDEVDDEKIWDGMEYYNKEKGEEIFSRKLFDENLKKNQRNIAQEYQIMAHKGLLKYLESKIMNYPIDQLKFYRKSLVKLDILEDKNINVTTKFREKFKPIMILIERKLGELKPEDGEL